jgi:hypothetical protein
VEWDARTRVSMWSRDLVDFEWDLARARDGCGGLWYAGMVQVMGSVEWVWGTYCGVRLTEEVHMCEWCRAHIVCMHRQQEGVRGI